MNGGEQYSEAERLRWQPQARLPGPCRQGPGTQRGDWAKSSRAAPQHHLDGSARQRYQMPGSSR
jgi:hypothetical protein